MLASAVMATPFAPIRQSGINAGAKALEEVARMRQQLGTVLNGMQAEIEKLHREVRKLKGEPEPSEGADS